MRFEEKLKVFLFNEDWLQLGLIDPQFMEQLWEEYQKGIDPHQEHYRWRAFKKFLGSTHKFDDSTIRGLYSLALRDPDKALGASMLHELVERAEFPLDLLKQLLDSEYKSIAKKAKKQIENRKE